MEELKHDLRTAFEVVDKDDNGELSKDDVRKGRGGGHHSIPGDG